jgi:cellulose biosynthesis protein BcsQ
MRRIIAVIDNDYEYSRRLASYINERERMGLKAVAFSSPDNYRSRRNEYDVRIMLISEDIGRLLKSEEMPEMVLRFSEDSLAAGTDNRRSIFKYKRADSILRDIMGFYSDDDMEKLTRVMNKNSVITGIFSPVGRSGKTSLALTLGLYLAQSSRTLLITLEDLSGVFRYTANDAKTDLTDVLYSFQQGKYSWTKLVYSVYTFGGLDYIPPARYSEDLYQMNGEMLCELILKISADCGYDNIVLDMGSFSRTAGEVLEICDHLIMPVVKDASAMCKVEECMDSLQDSGHAEMTARIRKVVLPLERRDLRTICEPEGYMSGPLYDASVKIWDERARSKGDAYE